MRWAATMASLTACLRSRSRTLGGKTPWRQPMVATTLGSLNVAARVTRSPRAAVARSQYRAKRSGACSYSHVPRAANHRGWVKWWKVTTGATPCSWQVAHIRR
jgi:hypothetical protein